MPGEGSARQDALKVPRRALDGTEDCDRTQENRCCATKALAAFRCLGRITDMSSFRYSLIRSALAWTISTACSVSVLPSQTLGQAPEGVIARCGASKGTGYFFGMRSRIQRGRNGRKTGYQAVELSSFD